MALKFLNKKGWHTGSLRNIENVWKAEQKHEAEQKKLEELKKQIQDERERSEFIQLQEQAGLVPRQEKLGFLYDSGLAVGKTSTSKEGGSGVAFKAFEETVPGKPSDVDAAPSSEKQQAVVPGALFEDKPHSANDAWRKLHSDPLLMIRQREQEALARIKNNPIQMAKIRKSVEKNKEKDKDHDKRQKKHKHGKSKHHKRSSKEELDLESDDVRHPVRRNSDRKDSGRLGYYSKAWLTSDDELSEGERQTRDDIHKSSRYRGRSPSGFSRRRSGRHDDSRDVSGIEHGGRHTGDCQKERESRTYEGKSFDSSAVTDRPDSLYKRRSVVPKLSEEERAAKLREMQADAEVHEVQRWKRLKRAAEDDAQEAANASLVKGRNFLDATHRSVYGAEKGGSSTIEESVRRRTYYLQGRSEDGNAFRR